MGGNNAEKEADPRIFVGITIEGKVDSYTMHGIVRTTGKEENPSSSSADLCRSSALPQDRMEQLLIDAGVAVADLSQCTYLGHAGIHSLCTISDKRRRGGKPKLMLINVPFPIMDALNYAQLTDTFDYYKGPVNDAASYMEATLLSERPNRQGHDI